MIPYFSNKQILTFTIFVSFLSYVDCIYSSIVFRKKNLSDYSIKILSIKSSIKCYRRILSHLSTSVAYILHFRLISVYILFSWPYFLFLSFLFSIFLSFSLSFFLSFFISIYLSAFLSFFPFSFFDYSIPGSVAA